MSNRPPRLRAGVHSCERPRPSHGGGHHPRPPSWLYEDKPPRQVVVDLMTRGLKRETD